MSKQIELYRGTGFNENATLSRYEYGDGTTNHWLFRNRLGMPYNPESEEEANEIIKRWGLKKIDL